MQKSIKESVYKLLCDQIKSMGLGGYYDIIQNEIRGRVGTTAEGTTFNFDGLRLDATALKSYEGVDICWVEEAQSVSAASWKDLIPTIRKKDSNIYGVPSVAEIWVTFNPDLETDPTYVRFIKRSPSNMQRVYLTYEDNPWFGEPMLSEMLDLKRDDFDEYEHVWLGKCKQNLQGAVYADEMREASTQGRIRNRDAGGVPYDRSGVVDVICDLGKDNYSALIFKQIVAFEHRYIDYYQNRMKDVDHYTQVIKNRGYSIGTVWLPHDAAAKRLGSKMSIEEQFKEKFPEQVRIIPRLSIEDGINAMRTIFPQSYFDEEKCADLLTCLRRYRYELLGMNAEMQPIFSRTPIHDEYSDGADAARYSGVVSKMGRKAKGGLASRLRIPGLSRAEAESQGVEQVKLLLRPRDFDEEFGGSSPNKGWLNG